MTHFPSTPKTLGAGQPAPAFSFTITPRDIAFLQSIGATAASDPNEIESAEMRLAAIRKECARNARERARNSGLRKALWASAILNAVLLTGIIAWLVVTR